MPGSFVNYNDQLTVLEVSVAQEESQKPVPENIL